MLYKGENKALLREDATTTDGEMVADGNDNNHKQGRDDDYNDNEAR